MKSCELWGKECDFDKCRLKGHFVGGRGCWKSGGQDREETQRNQLNDVCTGCRVIVGKDVGGGNVDRGRGMWTSRRTLWVNQRAKSVSHTESKLLWTTRGYPQPRSGRRGQRCVGPTGALGAHILHILPSSSPTKRPPSLYYGVFRLPFDWPSLFLLIPSHPDQTRRSFIKPYSVPFGDRFVELEGVLFRPVFEPPSPIVQWPRRREWDVGKDEWFLWMGRNRMGKWFIEWGWMVLYGVKRVKKGG